MRAYIILFVGMLTVYLGLIILQLLLTLIGKVCKKLYLKKTTISDEVEADASYIAACVALAIHVSHKVEYTIFSPSHMTNWQIIKGGL